MPVTIGTLSSSVHVTDGAGPNDEMTERIVAIALARMRDELRREKETKADGDVEERRSEPEPY